MAKWIPVAGSEVLVKSAEHLLYGTVLGFFDSDKSVLVRPHAPWPDDVLFAGDQSASYNDTARTWGSTSDGVLYVGDECVARSVPTSWSDSVVAKVVGIFPDDAVAISFSGHRQTHLWRVARVNATRYSKGWGRWLAFVGL